MENFARELSLANGLTVSIRHHTSRYFGDYHLVKLEILCKAPLSAEYFGGEGDFAAARALLGDEVVYRRMVEQLGVPSAETEQVLNRLMAEFEKTSLPYLAAPGFPGKLVLAELAKKRKRTRHLPAFQP